MDDRRSADRNTRPKPRQASETSAREVFRRWMRDIDGDELSRVGSAAILQSVDAVGRLADMARGPSAEAVLLEVEKLATGLMTPPSPRARWRWFRRAGGAGDLPQHAMISLIDRLERRRDDGVRRIIALTTVRTRLEVSERALDDALLLIEALERTIEAGIRELQVGSPGRAAVLQERGSVLLLERRRAVLTQSSIHRQSTMTLDLLMANQQTLDAVLERTRTATVSALQVASTASGATADAAALHADSMAAKVRRTLYEALEQVRAALAATDRQEDGSMLDRRP